MVSTNSFNFLYDVGQTVYARVSKKRQVPVQCVICNSTGEVVITGKTFTCPECHGEKNTLEELVVSAEPFTVIRVMAAKCASRGCRVRYEVSGGRAMKVFEESELYASEAEANPAQDH